MKILERHRFHGPALAQIVEDAAYKSLNASADGRYGHYVLNNNTRLFVKYTTDEGPMYRFTLSLDEIETIEGYSDTGGRVFLVLVCGAQTICVVTSAELADALDGARRRAQQVWVRSEPNKQLRFGGPRTTRPLLIPHSRFPSALLQ